MQVREFPAEEKSAKVRSVLFNSLVVAVQLYKRSDKIVDQHGMQMVVVTRSIFRGFHQRSPL